jgi:hypothetical protein
MGAALLCGVGTVTCWSADPLPNNPRLIQKTPSELGLVVWGRDFPAALALATKEKRPLLVLFDEVPGCQTCKGFGAGPLSHPLVVDAAGEFISVAVYNNVSGPDAEILTRFKEPAWNNPVIRFLDADGSDLIPRKDGEYTAGFLISRMARALEKAGRPVPEYMKLAVAEYAPNVREKAVFAMYCYWEGEAKLGRVEGVIGTRIGMLNGSESVEVEFDPTVLGYKTLLGKAMELDCAHKVFARTNDQFKAAREVVGNEVVRSDKAIDARTSQQHDLAHYQDYYFLPLTALQATRVNAAVAANESPDGLLSPSQLALLKKTREAIGRNPKVFAGLTPDRSQGGLPRYLAKLEKLLTK